MSEVRYELTEKGYKSHANPSLVDDKTLPGDWLSYVNILYSGAMTAKDLFSRLSNPVFENPFTTQLVREESPTLEAVEKTLEAFELKGYVQKEKRTTLEEMQKWKKAKD